MPFPTFGGRGRSALQPFRHGFICLTELARIQSNFAAAASRKFAGLLILYFVTAHGRFRGPVPPAVSPEQRLKLEAEFEK
jgi:hypothetical protein